MTDIGVLFVDAAVTTRSLLSEPALAERFDGPSVLAEFPVRGLVGHLLRALTTVEAYLDRPEPFAGPGTGREIITPAEYYAAVLDDLGDLHSEGQQAIRRRSAEAAPDGPRDLPAVWAETCARLATRLDQEPATRLVQVYGDHVLTLDGYLVTRLIELIVHSNDLAASVGVPPPGFDSAATGLAIDTLVEVARSRHGDTAVLLALARRERDRVDALRVI